MSSVATNTNEVSVRSLINQIEVFRGAAKTIAKLDKDQKDADAFYTLLKEVAYTQKDNSSSGRYRELVCSTLQNLDKAGKLSSDCIFFTIIKLFEERLSYIKTAKTEYHYTFWLNYNTRFFHDERLGRLINPNEQAYRISRDVVKGSSYFEILSNNNVDDYNVYYFNRVIVQGSVSAYKDDILSVQEILSLHKDIETIKVYWDDVSNSIHWDIKLFGDRNIYTYSSEGVNLFATPKQLDYYTTFLKRTFGLPLNDSEIPPYIVDEDVFRSDNASYIPSFLFICNLTAPYSSDYAGSIMFSSDRDFDIVELSKEVSEIKSIVGIISDTEAEYINIKNNQFILRESIKSAVAAIMSRNMSHNLGSHYLYYTKTQLNKIADSAAEIGPDIRGAARVLGYIQARMDYLATVISNDRYTAGSVNFKSQIFDELTVDEFSKRHFSDNADINKRITNFLLANIIMSENYTRPDVRGASDIRPEGGHQAISLYVRLLDQNNKYKLFTGTSKGTSVSDSSYAGRTMFSEKAIKEKISSIYLSLPGGGMSCHAFFNVVENFIRNSAKYLHADTDLVFTIAISRDSSGLYHFVLYDNKHNANEVVNIKTNQTLFESITEKLSQLKIIDDSSMEVEKQSKGFKEMLFSALWMHLNSLPRGLNYADLLLKINEAEQKERLDLIEEYAFAMREVVPNGDSLSIYGREKISSISKDDLGKACLGIEFVIPEYRKSSFVHFGKDYQSCINTVMRVHSDIVEVDSENYDSNVFGRCFTRVYRRDSGNPKVLSDIDKFLQVLNERFGDINQYKLVFDQKREKLDDDEESIIGVWNTSPDRVDGNNLMQDSTPVSKVALEKKKNLLVLIHHLNTKFSIDGFKDYGYADTVSGGNFSYTIKELFEKGINSEGEYRTDDDRYFALKIKESALTRITIIDERLFNSMNNPLEYQLKNIRLLNYFDDNHCIEGDLLSVFDGNSFSDGRPDSLFLSIHLGLIEKILKNSRFINDLINRKLNVDSVSDEDALRTERVSAFMSLLKDSIRGNDKTKELFVSIHSGRGNFSKELEGPLAPYPFITLSSLEYALNNSKYLLSQLFYNTIYVGKGMLNKQGFDE